MAISCFLHFRVHARHEPLPVGETGGSKCKEAPKIIDLADLVDKAWIVAPPYSWNHRRLAEAFQARGLEMPKASLVMLSVHVVGRLLANGEYITAFPRSWVRVNALKILPVDLPPRPWPVVILTLKNRTLNPVVERFIQCVREVTKSMA